MDNDSEIAGLFTFSSIQESVRIGSCIDHSWGTDILMDLSLQGIHKTVGMLPVVCAGQACVCRYSVLSEF